MEDINGNFFSATSDLGYIPDLSFRSRLVNSDLFDRLLHDVGRTDRDFFRKKQVVLNKTQHSFVLYM